MYFHMLQEFPKQLVRSTKEQLSASADGLQPDVLPLAEPVGARNGRACRNVQNDSDSDHGFELELQTPEENERLVRTVIETWSAYLKSGLSVSIPSDLLEYRCLRAD